MVRVRVGAGCFSHVDGVATVARVEVLVVDDALEVDRQTPTWQLCTRRRLRTHPTWKESSPDSPRDDVPAVDCRVSMSGGLAIDEPLALRLAASIAPSWADKWMDAAAFSEERCGDNPSSSSALSVSSWRSSAKRICATSKTTDIVQRFHVCFSALEVAKNPTVAKV